MALSSLTQTKKFWMFLKLFKPFTTKTNEVTMKKAKYEVKPENILGPKQVLM